MLVVSNRKLSTHTNATATWRLFFLTEVFFPIHADSSFVGASAMSPEVHCNLCNYCYTLGMPDPRPDIRCTVLKASPGPAISGRDMLCDIPYIADWNKIGDYRQCQTDLNTKREKNSQINYDYKVGGKVLVRKDGILRKTESWYDSEHNHVSSYKWHNQG